MKGLAEALIRRRAIQVLSVLVLLVAGAAVLLLGGDKPSAQPSRIQATQGSVPPLVFDSAGAASPSETPATPPGQVTTAAAGSPGPAAANGSGSGSDSDATPAPAATSTSGSRSAIAAGLPPSPDGVAGDGPILGAAPAADPAGESSTSSMPAATSTSTSTTRAPEVTTTTTSTTLAPVRTGPTRAPGPEAEVVPLTNRDRGGQGLGPLTRNACLDSVASGYAEKMASGGALAHNPGAGPAVTGCRANATWGDNVGTSAPCDTDLLETEWMASPSHRRNILTGEFTLIGVGAWTDSQGGCWIQVLFST